MNFKGWYFSTLCLDFSLSLEYLRPVELDDKFVEVKKKMIHSPHILNHTLDWDEFNKMVGYVIYENEMNREDVKKEMLELLGVRNVCLVNMGKRAAEETLMESEIEKLQKKIEEFIAVNKIHLDETTNKYYKE